MTIKFRLVKYRESNTSGSTRPTDLGVEFLYENKAFLCMIERTFTVMNDRTSLSPNLFVLFDAKVRLFSEGGASSNSGSAEDVDDMEEEEDKREAPTSPTEIEDDWNRVQVDYVLQRHTSSACFPHWFSIERSRMSSYYSVACMQVLNGKHVFEIGRLKCEDAVELMQQFHRSVEKYGRNAKYVHNIREFEVHDFVDCNRNQVVLTASEYNLG